MQLLEFEGINDTSVSSMSNGNTNDNVDTKTLSLANSTANTLLWKSNLSQDVLQQIIDLLLTVTWDDIEKVEVIRQSRTIIANLLDIVLPSAVIHSNNGNNRAKRVNDASMDDFENYSSLIKDLNG